MEKDDELKSTSGSSYDFGARMYDPRLGRWLSLDLAARNYPGVSDYSFALNNPLIFIDPDGRVVVGINEGAKQAIKFSISPEESKYLKFNRKGEVRQRALRRGGKKFGDNASYNFKTLLFLSNEETVTTYEVTTSFFYTNAQGQIEAKPKEFGGRVSPLISTYEGAGIKELLGITFEEFEQRQKAKFPYGNYTKQVIDAGFTLVPENPESNSGMFSGSNSVRILINGNSDLRTQAGTVGHEGAAHAKRYLEGKTFEHGNSKVAGWGDFDDELESEGDKGALDGEENYDKHQQQQK